MIERTRGFFAEFRNFAVKGNALELAVAVVIGNAFGAIVSSLVGDIITPLMGLATGNVDFKVLSFSIGPNLSIRYGAFAQAVFNFLVISLSIFVVFKLLATARKRFFAKEEKTLPPYEKPAQERLLEEIRDLLKTRK
jgi:large conductance mechanosensitive channel